MKLRKGKTKSILESSIDSALLAVEIYNKPRTVFRCEGYITLMIMAWTRLFHAYFHHTIGNRYYYKNKKGRYERVDGERKAWELKTCINKLTLLSPAIKENLLFFIRLRNKIEHRHIEKGEVDILIFGECQSLLYNYEKILAEHFGEEYAINESLVFSLQFSRYRTREQKLSNKKILSKEIRYIRDYVEKYRNNLSDEIFNSQEFSIKLIQIPKISNTSRKDLAIEFVSWSELIAEDKANYEKLDAIIKDKVIKKEAINVGKLKAGGVLRQVKKQSKIELNHYDHRCFYYVFSIRPIKEESKDPFETNTKYCHYDECHYDYIYQDIWVSFLIKTLLEKKVSLKDLKKDYKARQKRDISTFE